MSERCQSDFGAGPVHERFMYWSGAEAVLDRCQSGDFGAGAVPERRFRCRANRLLQHHISDSVTHFFEKHAVFEEIRAFFCWNRQFPIGFD